MTEDYGFILKYNDLHVIERQSTRTGIWKDIAAFTTAERANAKLNEIKVIDRKKHNDPNFYKYKITVLKKTGK